MKIVIEDTDLNLIADDIMSSVRMLELADEDTAIDDLELYLPRIRKAVEDLNSKAATAAPERRFDHAKKQTDSTGERRSGEAEKSKEGTEIPGEDLHGH